jgi:hypothetical protein
MLQPLYSKEQKKEEGRRKDDDVIVFFRYILILDLHLRFSNL